MFITCFAHIAIPKLIHSWEIPQNNLLINLNFSAQKFWKTTYYVQPLSIFSNIFIYYFSSFWRWTFRNCQNRSHYGYNSKITSFSQFAIITPNYVINKYIFSLSPLWRHFGVIISTFGIFITCLDTEGKVQFLS